MKTPSIVGSRSGVVEIDPIVSAAIKSRRRIGLFAVLVWLIAGRAHPMPKRQRW
jgi:hypothetical protein